MRSFLLTPVLAIVISLWIPQSASAAKITYSLNHVANNEWMYQYTVAAEPTDPVIEEFTVYFDLPLYENLRLFSTPPNWDALVIQPDTGLAADGFFDALALTAGIAPGATQSGFGLLFDYLGSGSPGSQFFEIVDPDTFSRIASSRTSVALPPPTEIPAPPPIWLLLIGLPFLVRRSLPTH